MVISANPLTLKRIILVKQILQRAIVNSKANSGIDKIISVILFDLANETMLNAILTSIDSTKTPADKFPSLLNQVDEVLSRNSFDSISDRANILRVHNIRNDAQHDAREPSGSELSDCSTYARDFLKNVTKQIWDLDLDKISLAGEIKESMIRSNLIDAENELNKKDFKKATEKAVTGFESAVTLVGTSIVGRQPWFDNILVVTDAFGKEMKSSTEYSEGIEKMRKTLLFLTLNLSYSDYLKFIQITGTPQYSIGDTEPSSFLNAKTNLTENDAEFAVAFAVNGVISMESIVGELSKPFGKIRDLF